MKENYAVVGLLCHFLLQPPQLDINLCIWIVACLPTGVQQYYGRAGSKHYETPTYLFTFVFTFMFRFDLC